MSCISVISHESRNMGYTGIVSCNFTEFNSSLKISAKSNKLIKIFRGTGVGLKRANTVGRQCSLCAVDKKKNLHLEQKQPHCVCLLSVALAVKNWDIRAAKGGTFSSLPLAVPTM